MFYYTTKNEYCHSSINESFANNVGSRQVLSTFCDCVSDVYSFVSWAVAYNVRDHGLLTTSRYSRIPVLLGMSILETREADLRGTKIEIIGRTEYDSI